MTDGEGTRTGGAAEPLEAAEEAAPEVFDELEVVGETPQPPQDSRTPEPSEDSEAHDAEEHEEVEYEYVYEDEHGNPIEAPDGEVNPDHYHEEVVEEVDEAAGAEGEASPSAATVSISPEERETRRVRSGSTRRAGGRSRATRQSGRRSSRELDPDAMKHAKLKTLILLGSIALIPLLIVAIILVWCYKHGKLFWKKQVVVVEEKNDYEKGMDLRSMANRAYMQGDKLMREGKDDAAYDLLCVAEKDFDRAVKLIQGWREQNTDEGYSYIDERIADINIKLRAVREYKFQIEMRRARGGR
jgi:hypothetical protein